MVQRNNQAAQSHRLSFSGVPRAKVRLMSWDHRNH